MREKYLCTECMERIGMIKCVECGKNCCRKCVYKTEKNNFYCAECYWMIVENKNFLLKEKNNVKEGKF